MNTKDKLTYQIGRIPRSLIDKPTTFIGGDNNRFIINKILNQLLEKSTVEELEVVSLLKDGYETIDVDEQYINNTALNTILDNRYDYVIEHNFFSIKHEMLERGVSYFPSIILLIDNSYDVNHISELLMDAPKLGIFVFYLANEEDTLAKSREFIASFSQTILTKEDDKKHVSVEIYDMKYRLEINK